MDQRKGFSAQAFGERVKEGRKRLRLSQDAFASQLGTTQGTVSRWESGDQLMDLGEFLGLCELLNASPLFMLTGEGAREFSPTAAERKLEMIREIVATPLAKDASDPNHLLRIAERLTALAGQGAS